MAEIIKTENFVEDAVARIVADAKAAIAERGRFWLSLCGGGTPKPVYAALAKAEIDWSRALLTFGDERMVPPDHAQSNYRMVQEALLLPAAVPEANVLRMRGELEPEEAAKEYEALLERHGGGLFVHDLVLLGMGDDGHTASLFPGTKALEERERQVVANVVPQQGATRLTLTYRVLNAARAVCFLVNDPKKQSVIDAVLAGGSGYPAEKIAPAGRLTWLIGNGLRG